MATNSTIYAQIFKFVNDLCTEHINANIEVVANLLAPVAYSLLGIYVILWGFAHMQGMIKQPIQDAATRLIKVAFILGVGIKLGQYNVFVTDIFFYGPDQFGTALAQATSPTPTTPVTMIGALDTILDRGFQSGKKFWDQGGVIAGDFGMYGVALAVWTMTILVTAYSCALILLAKIGLALMIALGPMFIITLLFQATGEYFSRWVQFLANYFLVIVLFVAANTFVITLFSRAAAGSSRMTATEVDQVFPFLLTGVLALLAIAQIPQWAAGLAGGISLSSYGIGRMGLSLLAKTVKSSLGLSAKAGALAGRGMKKVARAGWNNSAGKAMEAYRNRKRNTVAKR